MSQKKVSDEVVKRYPTFRKRPIDWTNRRKSKLGFAKWVGKTPPHREKDLSGVKFRSAKCADVCTKSPCLFRFVSSRRQITAETSTFLHKMKKPGAVPSCYIYSVVSGSDSAAIAVFIPSLKPCSKPCRSYSTA